MRILVTGSSGHVGGAIVGQLAEQQYDVVGMSRRINERLPVSVRQVSLDLGAPDLVDRLQEAVGSCDAIVHAGACLLGDDHADEVMEINVEGTRKMLEGAHALGAASFIFISSLSLLGRPQRAVVTEEDPLAPGTAYARSKALGEGLVFDTAAAASLTGHRVALRISSPIGPGLQYKRIFRIFVERALQNEAITVHGEGARQQDYVDVRDVADGIIRLLDCPCTGIFNLGSGVPVSNLELAQRCISALASTSPLLRSGAPDEDDGLCWRLSIDKAAKHFGYTPAYSLEDSIHALAEELRAAL